MRKDLVYLFEYSDDLMSCCYETLSVHHTHDGAEREMMRHIEETKREHENTPEGFKSHSDWDVNKGWRVRPIKLLL
jgi:hypothetical protein